MGDEQLMRLESTGPELRRDHCGRILAAVTASLLTVLLVAANAHLGDPIRSPMNVSVSSPYPPCSTEDSGPSLPCLWDATVRGNGVGRSFIIERDGSTIYLDGGK